MYWPDRHRFHCLEIQSLSFLLNLQSYPFPSRSTPLNFGFRMVIQIQKSPDNRKFVIRGRAKPAVPPQLVSTLRFYIYDFSQFYAIFTAKLTPSLTRLVTIIYRVSSFCNLLLIFLYPLICIIINLLGVMAWN